MNPRIAAAAAVLAAAAGAACYSGDATLGAACERDDDCGTGQTCTTGVCGYCGDGVAQAGELCFIPGASTLVGPEPVAVRAIDADDDGTQDLVTTARDAEALVVLRGRGRRFERATEIPVPTRLRAHAIVDIDADGRGESIVAGPVGLWLGRPGEPAPAYDYELVASFAEPPTSMAAASATPITSALVAVTEPRADGMVALRVLISAGGGLRESNVVRTVAPGSIAAAVGDALSDTMPSVVVLDPAGALAVYAWDGADPEATVDVAAGSTSARLLDADGNGTLDIVVAAPIAGVITVLGDDIGGELRIVEVLEVPGARAAAVHDVDRDTRRDLLVATDAGAAVWRTRGRAHPFATPLPLERPLSDVLAIDLDGDGLVELVGVAAVQGSVTVLEVEP